MYGFVIVDLVSKWCLSDKMYDLLPLISSRSGAPVLRSTICWVSKRCPIDMMHDLLPLLSSRSGAPVLRSKVRCRCFGFEVVTQC